MTIRYLSLGIVKGLTNWLTFQDFGIQRLGEANRGLIDETHVVLATDDVTDTRILKHFSNSIGFASSDKDKLDVLKTFQLVKQVILSYHNAFAIILLED